MEWSTIPACPSLMRFKNNFFNRGDNEGTNSSKILCSTFVYVLCKFVSGLILWFLNNLWFDGLRAGWMGDRLNIDYSRNIILCG